ncbi:uncharacterized protein LOC120005204 isoform X2 [Tripterygium wilfordii]|uniref:uncharacterized protein LOC120005204 isoform X2 n=1 Tax=Tripterygium wilfordii TaxID=458696 RepID=UPI0018F7E87E|nr:uncharacterized protein LOC120005204 isoform X2 [Tripterygium wilfordii]
MVMQNFRKKFCGGGLLGEELERTAKGGDVIVDLNSTFEDLYMEGTMKALLRCIYLNCAPRIEASNKAHGTMRAVIAFFTLYSTCCFCKPKNVTENKMHEKTKEADLLKMNRENSPYMKHQMTHEIQIVPDDSHHQK